MKQFLFFLLIAGVAEQSASQGVWTQKADFGGTARYAAVGFSIGTKGYIGTGSSLNGLTKDFWEWDQATDTWTQKADFGGGKRAFAVGFAIGNKGYIGTGTDTSHLYINRNDFWEWDPSTNIWTQKANFGGGNRKKAIGFSIGTKGYIGTGLDSITYKKDFWEWNSATDMWSKKTDFAGTARREATGFSINTKGYIGTGSDTTGWWQNDFWEWNQATDTWSPKANFCSCPTMNRGGAVGFSIGSKGYIGTGVYFINQGYEKDFWEYDTTNDTWTKMADVGTQIRNYAVGFSIGSKGYIGTGEGLNPYRLDFWEWDPLAIGTGEYEPKNFIYVYPNPFFEFTTVYSLKPMKDARLTIYNTYGQSVKQIQNITGDKVIFHRDNMGSGLYFICLTEKNKSLFIHKLLIIEP